MCSCSLEFIIGLCISNSPILLSTFRSFQLQNVFNLDNDNRAEDTPTLIDRKVRFIKNYFHFGKFVIIILAVTEQSVCFIFRTMSLLYPILNQNIQFCS